MTCLKLNLPRNDFVKLAYCDNCKCCHRRTVKQAKLLQDFNDLKSGEVFDCLWMDQYNNEYLIQLGDTDFLFIPFDFAEIIDKEV